ncbi:hypothetical protein AGLY_002316 [Aphis glycines]|uniref:Peptidase S1 domain-containing protein n=1 Tax=Aphis glycines TaxID=307491 RepID=A0A6G0U5L3_APHGL|nr:hypothetical protein AGLY_002316 [Aphis glycines]
MQIFALIILLSFIVLNEFKSTKHVHKGLIDDFKLEDYPYVMCLKILLPNKRVETCTGSLVAELFVLTAAHCVYGKDKKDLKVYQGSRIKSHDSRNVVKLYVHESYNHTSEVIIGDLSILKIEKSFSHIEEYIRIGGSPIDFANNKYLKCIVIGFGIINAEHEGFIKQIMVKHGRKACEGYDSVQIIDTWQQYLCEVPNKHKTYEGDSGGPMICNNLQYGVCSFSININGGDMQTVYVFIDYYRKWVNDIIEPVQSTSISAKRKRLKKNKINQKNDAKLIIPYYTLYIISGILWCM